MGTQYLDFKQKFSLHLEHIFLRYSAQFSSYPSKGLQQLWVYKSIAVPLMHLVHFLLDQLYSKQFIYFFVFDGLLLGSGAAVLGVFVVGVGLITCTLSVLASTHRLFAKVQPSQQDKQNPLVKFTSLHSASTATHFFLLLSQQNPLQHSMHQSDWFALIVLQFQSTSVAFSHLSLSLPTLKPEQHYLHQPDAEI